MGFQESETIRTIRKLSETARLASLALNESELMKSLACLSVQMRINISDQLV